MSIESLFANFPSLVSEFQSVGAAIETYSHISNYNRTNDVAVRLAVCVCVRACVRACVRVCVCVCVAIDS